MTKNDKDGTPLYIDSPNAELRPRDYQIEMAKWLVDHPFYGRLCADGLGVGKTAEALTASRMKLFRGDCEFPVTLILTTANSVFDWIREAKKFWPELSVTRIDSGKTIARRKNESDESLEARRQEAWNNAEWRQILRKARDGELLKNSYDSNQFDPKLHHYAIIGDIWWSDLVMQEIGELGVWFDEVIIDEFHNLKKANSRREKACKMLINGSRKSTMMTATLAHDRAKDVFNLLKLMDPNTHNKSIYAWARDYFHFEHKEVEALGRSFVEIADVKDREALNEYLARYVWGREARVLMGKELPPRQHILRSIEGLKVPKMSPAKLRVKKSESVQELVSQMVEAKLHAAVEFAETIGKPAVFYTYRPMHAERLAALMRKHGLAAVHATGSQTPKARDKVVQDWKSGQVGLFLCASMDALKESATLTRADTMVFVDLHVMPTTVLQVQGRIDPARQAENERRPVFYYYLVTKDGPDEIVAETLVQKLTEISGIGVTNQNADEFNNFLKPLDKRKKLVQLSDEDVMASLIERLNARADRLADIGML